ncbi:MAG: hypothetical protein AB7H97_06315, partial [Pseudobdellovibrionaceae bacterium]
MDKSIEPLRARIPAKPRQTSVPASVLIDRIMDFDRSRVQGILKGIDSASSGTKEELRYLIEQSVRCGNLSLQALSDFIFEWEPWSHRHCYFIKIHKDDIAAIKDQNQFKKQLTESKLYNRLNAHKIFHIPSSLKIDTIKIKENLLIVELVAPVFTYERRESEDKYDENSQMVWQAKQRKISRKIFLLEISLRTGKGFLSIPSAQQGQSYSREFVRIEKMIKEAIGISRFEITPINGAIENLMGVEQSVSNSLSIRFDTGHRVQIKSPQKHTEIFEDPKMDGLKKIVQREHYDEGGFYFLEDSLKPICRDRKSV